MCYPVDYHRKKIRTALFSRYEWPTYVFRYLWQKILFLTKTSCKLFLSMNYAKKKFFID